MSEETTITLVGLDKLIKAFKNPPKIQVGIFGGARDGSGALTNAEVGAFHEFGTSKLPQRSFLRIPLIEHLGPQILKLGLASDPELAKVVKSGSMVSWSMKIGVLAEGIVLTAFDSGGYGKWKQSNMKLKKVHQTLVETQQLRNSITHRITETK